MITPIAMATASRFRLSLCISIPVICSRAPISIALPTNTTLLKTITRFRAPTLRHRSPGPSERRHKQIRTSFPNQALEATRYCGHLTLLSDQCRSQTLRTCTTCIRRTDQTRFLRYRIEWVMSQMSPTCRKAIQVLCIQSRTRAVSRIIIRPTATNICSRQPRGLQRSLLRWHMVQSRVPRTTILLGTRRRLVCHTFAEEDHSGHTTASQGAIHQRFRPNPG